LSVIKRDYLKKVKLTEHFFNRTNPAPKSGLVYGRREVRELLGCSLHIERVLALEQRQGSNLDDILNLAAARGIPVRFLTKPELDRLTARGVHQGIAAYYELPVQPDLNEILADLASSSDHNLIILDGLEDPQNFGAVVRSAEVFGSRAVIYPRRRAVGLTPVVVKVSAGAALRMPLIEVYNIAQILKTLKQAGYWIYGLDPAGRTDLWTADLSGKIGFVFGAEGRGLARLTKERCDFLISIKQVGRIGSLNVSASAAVTLAEWLRQRHQSATLSTKQ